MAPRGFRHISKGCKKVGNEIRDTFRRTEDPPPPPPPPPPPLGTSTEVPDSQASSSTIPSTESARARVLLEALAQQRKWEEEEKKMLRLEEEERERQKEERKRQEEEERKRHEAEEKKRKEEEERIRQEEEEKDKDGDDGERKSQTGKSNSSKDNSREGDGDSGLSGETKQGTSPPRFVASRSQELLISPSDATPRQDHLGQFQSGWVSASAIHPSAVSSFSSNPHGNNETSGVSSGLIQYPPEPRLALHPYIVEGLKIKGGSDRSRLIRTTSFRTDWAERRLRERARVERERELTRPEEQAQDRQNSENSVAEDSTKPADQNSSHTDGESSPEQELSQSGDVREEDDNASQKSKSSEPDGHPGKGHHLDRGNSPRCAAYYIGAAGGQPSTNAGGQPAKGAKSTTKSDQESLQITIDDGLPFHGVIQRLETISRADDNWSQVCTAVNIEVRLTEDNYPVVHSGTKIPEHMSWSDACKSHDREDLLKNHGLMRLEDFIQTAGNWMTGFRVFLDIQSNLNADKVLGHLCRELAGIDDDVIPRELIVICLPELRYLPFLQKLQGYTVVLNCLNLNTARQAIEMDTSPPIHVKLKYSIKINMDEGEAILKLKGKADNRHRYVYIEPIDDESQIKWCIRVDFAGIVTQRPYDLDRWYRQAERRISWKDQPLFSLIVDHKGEIRDPFGF
ncbi:hypothetical protein BDV19DRAFT_384680 [Aspergillus venezuelensis]